ncbi:YceI family protein [Pricia antarctica]|nr:YceI family protein [Pricia antarctica]
MKKCKEVKVNSNLHMFKNVIFLLSILFLLLGGNNSFAQVYSTEDGNAAFKARMPLNSYTGESDQLRGTINFKTGKVAFKVPVKSIKTRKDKRDEHMHELLKAEKNPNVIFEGKLIDDFDFNKKTEQTIKLTGNFTLGGTTRQLSIDINLEPVAKGLQLNASWSLLITDYNLERPSLAFIKVNDKHDLSVDALLKER